MKKIAITCGDPSGIGPEVIAAWARSHPNQLEGLTVFGPHSWLTKDLGDLPLAREPVGPVSYQARLGKPDPVGAQVALAALERAAEGCRQGQFAAVVTGPISKAQMREAGFQYPGQTEFFADRWGGEPTMAFLGKKLRVVLATWHDPLMQVAGLLQDGRLLARAVQRAFLLGHALGMSRPRVGVCGLNPHAGEAGLLGREEVDWLDPQLQRLRDAYPGLSLTQPGDTLFWRAVQGEFDLVVALYHDQGLAPLKVLEFESAVNVTLGLPFLRVSPDHGTAFAIAGKGLARTESFATAVELARTLRFDSTHA